MKAYLVNSNVELEIRGFYNEYNRHGIACLMCVCYASALDCTTDVPAARIEIR